jgi:hypothetical protein
VVVVVEVVVVVVLVAQAAAATTATAVAAVVVIVAAVLVTAAAFSFHWLYSSRGPWPLLFFSHLIYSQLVGLLGNVISPSQGRYLNTGQHKHRTNTYTTH